MRIRLDLEITTDEARALDAFEKIATRFDVDSPIRIAARILRQRDRAVVPTSRVKNQNFYGSWKNRTRNAKRMLVEEAIKANYGNISAAARTLGMSRQTVYSILGKSRPH